MKTIGASEPQSSDLPVFVIQQSQIVVRHAKIAGQNGIGLSNRTQQFYTVLSCRHVIITARWSNV